MQIVRHRAVPLLVLLVLVAGCGSPMHSAAGGTHATKKAAIDVKRFARALKHGALKPLSAAPADASTNGGGGRNVVHAVNRVNDRLLVDGQVQVNTVPATRAAPENIAYAYSSCTDCTTLSVALQINLISQSASTIAPQNAAVALNYQCTGCDTHAVAFQYDYTVADPTHPPARVQQLVNEMNQTLNGIRSTQGETLADAEAKVNGVIAQFSDLAQYLNTQQQDTTDTTSPNATPLPATTPAADPTATSTPMPST